MPAALLHPQLSFPQYFPVSAPSGYKLRFWRHADFHSLSPGLNPLKYHPHCGMPWKWNLPCPDVVLSSWSHIVPLPFQRYPLRQLHLHKDSAMLFHLPDGFLGHMPASLLMLQMCPWHSGTMPHPLPLVQCHPRKGVCCNIHFPVFSVLPPAGTIPWYQWKFLFSVKKGSLHWSFSVWFPLTVFLQSEGLSRFSYKLFYPLPLKLLCPCSLSHPQLFSDSQ